MNKKTRFILGYFSLVLSIGLGLSRPIAPARVNATQIFPTPSLSPTATVRPSPTATTTPLPNVQLPAWMRDPTASVMVLFVDGLPTFLNVETGERFTLKLPYVGGVRWVDASDGVYIDLERLHSAGADNSSGFDEFIKLDSGVLVRLPLSDTRAPSQRLSTPPPVGNGRGASYQLVVKAEWVAANKQHDMYRLLTYGDIILNNSATGKSTVIFRNDPGETGPINVQWIAGGHYLAIWDPGNQTAGTTDWMKVVDDNGEPILWGDEYGQVRWSAAHSLMLYRDHRHNDAVCFRDVTSGYPGDAECKLLSKWKDRIQDYAWSQDGSKIIFTYTEEAKQSGGLCIADAHSHTIQCPVDRSVKKGSFQSSYEYVPGNAFGVFEYHDLDSIEESNNEALPRTGGLCLVSQRDYSVNCITDRLTPVDAYYAAAVLAPSGTVLALWYTGQAAEKPHDGVCLVHLQSGSVRCPNVSQIKRFVEQVSWSPDSRFLLVRITDTGPGSDCKSNTTYAVIDVAANTYRDEGSALYENELDTLWRPALAH